MTTTIPDAENEDAAAPTHFINDTIEEYDADILLINSPMSGGISDKLRNILDEKDVVRPNLVLFLVTSGGLADEAYRCGRMLQDRYEKITICIAGWCKSAGTLLAIAANEIAIGPKGELGPLDVQLTKRDELFDRDSGLISNAALDRLREESFQTFETIMLGIIAKSQNAITFRTAADVAADVTVGLMQPVFDKIDPMRLGTDARAMQIGSAYAQRLNLTAENLRGVEALNMLLNGYPSHSFVIDYGEAAMLFRKVKPFDGNLALVAGAMADHAVIPDSDQLVCFLNEYGGDDDEDPAIEEAPVETDPEGGNETAADVAGDNGPSEDIPDDIQGQP